MDFPLTLSRLKPLNHDFWILKPPESGFLCFIKTQESWFLWFENTEITILGSKIWIIVQIFWIIVSRFWILVSRNWILVSYKDTRILILVVLESRILEISSLMQGQTDLHQKRDSLGFVGLVQVCFQIYDFRTTQKSEFWCWGRTQLKNPRDFLIWWRSIWPCIKLENPWE